MWTECKQIYNSGLREYLLDNYNTIDFVVLSLYLGSYALRFLVDFWVKQAAMTYFNSTMISKEALGSGNYSLFNKSKESVFMDKSIDSYFMKACKYILLKINSM